MTKTKSELDRVVAEGGLILEPTIAEGSNNVSKQYLALVAIAETLPKEELELIDSTEVLGPGYFGIRYVLPPYLAQAVRDRVASGTFKPASCPAWCTSHEAWTDVPAITHRHIITVGEVEVKITEITGLDDAAYEDGLEVRGPKVEFDYEWVSGGEIRGLATALSMAADALGIAVVK